MILDKTYDLIKTKYKDQIENLIISDIRVGVFLTAIRLSDGSCGVASTDIDTNPPCSKNNRDFGDFTPTKIIGQRVIDLLETNKKLKLLDSMRVAVLNAISLQILSKSNYKILENIDPIDLIDLKSQKTITLVGGFHSYIRRISETNNKLYVLELDENVLTDEQKQYYVPAKEYTKILPISDVIIITGLTLVNNTIDGLLSAISPNTKVIVAGPSSSLIPDVLFENKVNIIGATRITDPSLLFSIVGEAGTGFHLFKYCAQKICILDEKN